MTERKPEDTMGLRYERLEFVPPESLDRLIESGDPDLIQKAIYSSTSYGGDWKWTQSQCLRFIKSEHQKVRWAAAQCLGTLAMLGYPVEVEKVLPALREALNDPSISGEADMSIDMVTEFNERNLSSRTSD
jgi:hypothetical protein